MIFLPFKGIFLYPSSTRISLKKGERLKIVCASSNSNDDITLTSDPVLPSSFETKNQSILYDAQTTAMRGGFQNIKDFVTEPWNQTGNMAGTIRCEVNNSVAKTWSYTYSPGTLYEKNRSQI